MTSRSDVDLLASAQKAAYRLALRDLEGFFYGLDLSRPEVARDLLLEFVPVLVREYGDVAASAAADWYEQVRGKSVSGNYQAMAFDGVGDEAVQGSVRYAAGHLFTDAPDGMLSVLQGAVQRFVSYSGRETVARNVQLDPAKPRFARVPSGAKTCAWCTLLASRGFVYHSKKTAGEINGHYHDACDCQIVAEWDALDSHIQGYDPDEMYGQYLSARQQLEDQGYTAPTDAEIAGVMRRMFPESFSDGVHE